jgi:hypothetical protein
VGCDGARFLPKHDGSAHVAQMSLAVTILTPEELIHRNQHARTDGRWKKTLSTFEQTRHIPRLSL